MVMAWSPGCLSRQEGGEGGCLGRGQRPAGAPACCLLAGAGLCCCCQAESGVRAGAGGAPVQGGEVPLGQSALPSLPWVREWGQAAKPRQPQVSLQQDAPRSCSCASRESSCGTAGCPGRAGSVQPGAPRPLRISS